MCWISLQRLCTVVWKQRACLVVRSPATINIDDLAPCANNHPLTTQGKDSTWGYQAYLTDDQKHMLGDLRKRVDAELPRKEYLTKDSTLLRYCRARNFNPSKTWMMLKEDVEWREQFDGYVYVRSRDFGGAYAMHEEGAIRLAGKAKDGRPVVMVQARYYWPKLVEDNIQIVYFFTFYVDTVCRMAEAIGEETFFAIADLDGFGMANFSLAQIKIAISLLQNHYPERLGMIYVINAPWAFTAAWRLIQPLLDERTKNKIEILGSDYYKTIAEKIDPAQIEKLYGGTHERWAVPDEIVQVSIDNEREWLNPTSPEATAKAEALEAAVSPGGVNATSSAIKAAAEERRVSIPLVDKAKSSTVRRRVRKMLKKMLFTTDTRAQANSVGMDPDAMGDEAPKRLTSGVLSAKLPLGTSSRNGNSDGASNGSIRFGAGEDEDGDAGMNAEIERDVVELKVEHDKLLESLHSQTTALKTSVMDLQRQLHFLLFLIITGFGVVFATVFKEKLAKVVHM